MITNGVCPLRCGQCCELWRGVEELNDFASRLPFDAPCPHLGARRCTLRRARRPPECNAYLCSVALAVIRGEIDRAYGLRLKARGEFEVPDAPTAAGTGPSRA